MNTNKVLHCPTCAAEGSPAMPARPCRHMMADLVAARALIERAVAPMPHTKTGATALPNTVGTRGFLYRDMIAFLAGGARLLARAELHDDVFAAAGRADLPALRRLRKLAEELDEIDVFDRAYDEAEDNVGPITP